MYTNLLYSTYIGACSTSPAEHVVATPRGARCRWHGCCGGSFFTRNPPPRRASVCLTLLHSRRPSGDPWLWRVDRASGEKAGEDPKESMWLEPRRRAAG